MRDERDSGEPRAQDDGAHEERPANGTHATAVARTVSGELEAEAIRTALESAGIPVRIKMESVAKLIAVTVDGLGKVEVLVPPDRLDEARRILDSVIDPDELEAQALSSSDDETRDASEDA